MRLRKPSPALIVAIIALIAAMSGSAIALQGKNSVRSDDIKDGQVKSADIKDRDVKSVDVKDGNLTGNDLKDDTLSGEQVDESTLEGVADGTRTSLVTTRPNNNLFDTVLVDTPGFGEIRGGYCQAGALKSQLSYDNTTGNPVDFAESGPNGNLVDRATASSTDNFTQDVTTNGVFTIQLIRSDGRIATVSLSVVNSGATNASDGNECRFSAQALIDP